MMKIAPSGRGIRRLFIHATSGEATAATTAAVTTGATIVCVSDASHTRPTRSSATPTRSHDVRPMSLSQRRRGEDACQLAGVDLDVVAFGRASATAGSPWAWPRRKRPRILIQASLGAVYGRHITRLG